MFPKFAPVAPTAIAGYLSDVGLLGDYHLLLAHDVVTQPVVYAQLYAKPNNFIIMDNSVIELGDAVSREMLIDACNTVNAQVLALPDVLMDGPATVQSTLKAFQDWNLPSNIAPMAIPQGETLQEWCNCFLDIVRYAGPAIEWIGIPKNFQEKLGFSRDIAINYVLQHMPNAKIHLLGFSNDFKDDLRSAFKHSKNVRGIDSAAPLWLGLRKFDIFSDADAWVNPEGQKRDDYWNNPTALGNDYVRMERNICAIRGVLSFGGGF